MTPSPVYAYTHSLFYSSLGAISIHFPLQYDYQIYPPKITAINTTRKYCVSCATTPWHPVPADVSCIYFTIFVIKQIRKYNMEALIVNWSLSFLSIYEWNRSPTEHIGCAVTYQVIRKADNIQRRSNDITSRAWLDQNGQRCRGGQHSMSARLLWAVKENLLRTRYKLCLVRGSELPPVLEKPLQFFF